MLPILILEKTPDHPGIKLTHGMYLFDLFWGKRPIRKLFEKIWRYRGVSYNIKKEKILKLLESFCSYSVVVWILA